jgi:hypothetical protein
MLRPPPLLFALILSSACAAKIGGSSGVVAAEIGGPLQGSAVAAPAEERAPAELLNDAESALAVGEAARAVAHFARFLATDPDEAGARQAYLGLARAHELLRDCAAALRAYGTYLDRFREASDLAEVYSRSGACHAELEEWELSAVAYQSARALTGDLLPSVRVEIATREGYARFQLGELEAAERLLAEADEIFTAAQEEGSERFTSYYFVGMARFYRAAIHHRRFRDSPIRLPEKVLTEDFARKFEHLQRAQEAYNHTIRAKHMFWVTASGYQLGSLFEEFYDALMYAPVPEWLDDKQRQVYYEELKGQLRPVVNKAIWVFEKNLETARRLGYESEFISRTEAKLNELQAILLAGDTGWGKPHPRLMPESRGEIAAGPNGVDVADPLPAVDRKLFVPLPTPL